MLLDYENTDAVRRLIPNSGGPYCACSVIDMVDHIVQDGVILSESVDRVTKVASGPRAVQSSAATANEVTSEASTTEAATGAGATAKHS